MLQDGTSTEWKRLVQTGRVVLWMWDARGCGVNLTASPSNHVIEKLMQGTE
jgi:hypothetical protein